MSICNLWTSPERSLVAVDTKSVALKSPGGFFETSKLLALPHAQCVFAVRGMNGFLGMLLFHLQNAVELEDFDKVVDALPASLPELLALFESGMKSQGVDGASGALQIVASGWSQRANRIATFLMIKPEDSTAFSIEEKTSMCISPGDDPFPKATPLLDNSDEMLSLAREQAAIARSVFPGKGFGGRLILAEVTRDRITITSPGIL